MNDHEILALLCSAEREAAALMLHASGVLSECKSGHRDVVTEYDRRVQALLMERFSAAVPSPPRRIFFSTLLWKAYGFWGRYPTAAFSRTDVPWSDLMIPAVT